MQEKSYTKWAPLNQISEVCAYLEKRSKSGMNKTKKHKGRCLKLGCNQKNDVSEALVIDWLQIDDLMWLLLT